MTTRWKDIAGWEGKYQVPRQGEVRNAVTGQVLKPMRTGTRCKRSKVRFSSNPRKDFDVAHLVLLAFVGPRPHGAMALHKDDAPQNNAKRNLFWGTGFQNMQQMAKNGRQRGSVTQKLVRADVVSIRKRLSNGEVPKTIACDFGVSVQRICDIKKGRTTLL